MNGETTVNEAVVDDAAQTSDVSAAQNVNVSQGFPDTVTPPAEGQPAAAPEETPAEGTPEEKPGDPVVARLQQQLASKNRLLEAAGFDPLSDVDEQLEKGLITAEQIRQHVASKFQPAPAAEGTGQQASSGPGDIVEQAMAVVETAVAEQQAAQEAYDNEIRESGGAVSVETNTRLIQANVAVADAKQGVSDAKLDQLTQQITAEKTSKQVNESVEQVLQVARAAPEFNQMDDAQKVSTEQVTLALTGLLADRNARERGIDPATLTGQHYQYFAQQATEELGKLAEFYRNLGREETKQAFLKNNLPPTRTGQQPNTTTPAPTGAPPPGVPTPADGSGSPAPTPDLYARVNSQNHADAAREYVKQAGRV